MAYGNEEVNLYIFLIFEEASISNECWILNRKTHRENGYALIYHHGNKLWHNYGKEIRSKSFRRSYYKQKGMSLI